SEAAPAEVPAEQEVQPAEAVPTEAARGADELPTGEGMATSGSALGNRVEVVMPKMGESVMEGTVLSWSKAVGDEVEQDETLLEISTDKVDSEVPSPAAGVLVEILVPEGETVEVGTPIAVIATGEGAAAPSPAPPAAPAGASEPAEQGYGEAVAGDGATRGEPAPAGAGEAGPIPRRSDSGRFYSPLVRSIAETEGLSLQELERIEGTGAEGRVTKQDVLAYLELRGSQPAVARPTAPPAAEPAPASAAPGPALGSEGRPQGRSGGEHRRRPHRGHRDGPDAAADLRAHDALEGDERPRHLLYGGRHDGHREAPRAAQGGLRAARG